WLSIVPIITVPVLMGGLPAVEITLSCNLALASICGALAAGLLASSLARTAAQAVALALILSFFGLGAMLALVGTVGAFSPGSGVTPFFYNNETHVFFAGFWMAWNLHTSQMWMATG